MVTLEAQQLSQNESPQAQLPLTPAREDDELRDELADIDPDSLTPRDALEAIYKLKALTDKRDSS